MLNSKQKKEISAKFTVVRAKGASEIRALIGTFNETIPMIFAATACFALRDEQGWYSVKDLKTVLLTDAELMLEEISEADTAVILADYSNGIAITDVGKEYITDVSAFTEWLEDRIELIDAVYVEQDVEM